MDKCLGFRALGVEVAQLMTSSNPEQFLLGGCQESPSVCQPSSNEEIIRVTTVSVRIFKNRDIEELHAYTASFPKLHKPQKQSSGELCLRWFLF